ncbi:esterase-like activity of phytase family protein [Oxalobacteraceae bacterium]|nr:esterase-like activity of phytase family protein [Oxalobacteraceae bacterium]
MKHLKLLPLLIAAAFTMPRAHSVELIAIGSMSALGSDLSSITAGPLENGVAGNILGGLGSGLAYAGNNTFLATPDRGPNALAYNPLVDNTTSYVSRFQTLNLSLSANNSGSGLAFNLTPTLTATTLLSSPTALVYGTGALGTGNGLTLGSGTPVINDASHNYFTGRSDNFDATKTSTNANNGRFDPEGVRVSNDGKSVFVSDEYGPYVYQFDRLTGQRINSFELPGKFAASNLRANGDDEIAANTSGRVANKGMEGLAITPDGKTLVGVMQANLAQDAKGLVRIVTIDIATKVTHEYAYKLTSGSGVSEILAVNDHQFLVDERDGKGLGDGSKAVAKQLFMVDLAGATDVSAIDSLKSANLAVNKSLFLDLVPVLKANGYTADQIPAKIEGISFGQDVMINGVLTHTLYVVNDNDFLSSAGDNKFFVFSVTDADLAKAGAVYVPQTVSSVPEASSYMMFLAGLCMMGLTMRSRRSEPFKP